MKLIDEKLGGTTPLEIILKFPKKEKMKTKMKMMNLMIGEIDENKDNEKYWFTKDKIE